MSHAQQSQQSSRNSANQHNYTLPPPVDTRNVHRGTEPVYAPQNGLQIHHQNHHQPHGSISSFQSAAHVHPHHTPYHNQGQAPTQHYKETSTAQQPNPGQLMIPTSVYQPAPPSQSPVSRRNQLHYIYDGRTPVLPLPPPPPPPSASSSAPPMALPTPHSATKPNPAISGRPFTHPEQPLPQLSLALASAAPPSNSAKKTAPSNAPPGSVAAPGTIPPPHPEVVRLTNHVLEPMRRSVEALWSQTLPGVQEELGKLYHMYTTLAEEERQRAGKVTEQRDAARAALSKLKEENNSLKRQVAEMQQVQVENARLAAEVNRLGRQVTHVCQALAQSEAGQQNAHSVIKLMREDMKAEVSQQVTQQVDQQITVYLRARESALSPQIEYQRRGRPNSALDAKSDSSTLESDPEQGRHDARKTASGFPTPPSLPQDLGPRVSPSERPNSSLATTAASSRPQLYCPITSAPAIARPPSPPMASLQSAVGVHARRISCPTSLPPEPLDPIRVSPAHEALHGNPQLPTPSETAPPVLPPSLSRRFLQPPSQQTSPTLSSPLIPDADHAMSVDVGSGHQHDNDPPSRSSSTSTDGGGVAHNVHRNSVGTPTAPATLPALPPLRAARFPTPALPAAPVDAHSTRQSTTPKESFRAVNASLPVIASPMPLPVSMSRRGRPSSPIVVDRPSSGHSQYTSPEQSFVTAPNVPTKPPVVRRTSQSSASSAVSGHVPLGPPRTPVSAGNSTQMMTHPPPSPPPPLPAVAADHSSATSARPFKVPSPVENQKVVGPTSACLERAPTTPSSSVPTQKITNPYPPQSSQPTRKQKVSQALSHPPPPPPPSPLPTVVQDQQPRDQDPVPASIPSPSVSSAGARAASPIIILDDSPSPNNVDKQLDADDGLAGTTGDGDTEAEHTPGDDKDSAEAEARPAGDKDSAEAEARPAGDKDSAEAEACPAGETGSSVPTSIETLEARKSVPPPADEPSATSTSAAEPVSDSAPPLVKPVSAPPASPAPLLTRSATSPFFTTAPPLVFGSTAFASFSSAPLSKSGSLPLAERPVPSSVSASAVPPRTTSPSLWTQHRQAPLIPSPPLPTTQSKSKKVRRAKRSVSVVYDFPQRFSGSPMPTATIPPSGPAPSDPLPSQSEPAPGTSQPEPPIAALPVHTQSPSPIKVEPVAAQTKVSVPPMLPSPVLPNPPSAPEPAAPVAPTAPPTVMHPAAAKAVAAPSSSGVAQEPPISKAAPPTSSSGVSQQPPSPKTAPQPSSSGVTEQPPTPKVAPPSSSSGVSQQPAAKETVPVPLSSSTLKQPSVTKQSTVASSSSTAQRPPNSQQTPAASSSGIARESPAAKQPPAPSSSSASRDPPSQAPSQQRVPLTWPPSSSPSLPPAHSVSNGGSTQASSSTRPQAPLSWPPPASTSSNPARGSPPPPLGRSNSLNAASKGTFTRQTPVLKRSRTEMEGHAGDKDIDHPQSVRPRLKSPVSPHRRVKKEVPENGRSSVVADSVSHGLAGQKQDRVKGREHAKNREVKGETRRALEEGEVHAKNREVKGGTRRALEEGEVADEPTPPPKKQSQPEARETPALKLGVRHMDFLYEKLDRLVCRFCVTRSRESKSDRLPIMSYPLSASWQTLVAHSQTAHPNACKELANYSPNRLAELRQRMVSRR
ncbi:hypothetical protein HGRIS_008924 [Hohenbuehelia grisea]|uniref:Uncharacterized protein n=1 Tax=Hohenbuehelia grisea TaxID=104357 RepID=A0ABR3IZQ4_9AGAR